MDFENKNSNNGFNARIKIRSRLRNITISNRQLAFLFHVLSFHNVLVQADIYCSKRGF